MKASQIAPARQKNGKIWCFFLVTIDSYLKRNMQPIIQIEPATVRTG